MNDDVPDPEVPPSAVDPADDNGAEPSPAVEEAILKLVAEIDHLREEIEQNNTRIRQLEELADRDPLAPVANRRAFLHELERFNDLAERYGTPSSVIYLDLNGMKEINDRFGHAAGDEVIVSVSEALLANVRASDVVGRLGGDEFGVILAHMGEALAKQKAEVLAGVIGELRVRRDGASLPVSVAWGVFTFTGEDDVAAALDAADKAMYAQKRDIR